MKSSRIPRKYQLSINFLDQNKTVFPIPEKFKTRTFPYSKNIPFSAEENVILHQLFESKEDRTSHLRKVQTKNFSIFRKHGIPCWRKYHLTLTFWIKRRPYFPSPKSIKQELSVLKKYGIPCWRKYHLTWTFRFKKGPYFPSPKSSKQELSHIWTFPFVQNPCFF